MLSTLCYAVTVRDYTIMTIFQNAPVHSVQNPYISLAPHRVLQKFSLLASMMRLLQEIHFPKFCQIISDKKMLHFNTCREIALIQCAVFNIMTSS